MGSSAWPWVVPEVQVADPGFNAAKTVALMEQAAAERAILVLFPELGLSAYSCEDLFHQQALLDGSLEALQTRAHGLRGLESDHRGWHAAAGPASLVQLRRRALPGADSRGRAEDVTRPTTANFMSCDSLLRPPRPPRTLSHYVGRMKFPLVSGCSSRREKTPDSPSLRRSVRISGSPLPPPHMPPWQGRRFS